MKKSIKTLEEISASAEVKKALAGLTGLTKPSVELRAKLDMVSDLWKVATPRLEKYMAVFTAWQNYLGEQTIIADTIQTVASSQADYYFSRAVKSSEGNVTEKKQLASSDPEYVQASQVAAQASAYFNALTMQFQNCDRAFKLTSRILTSRLGLKEIS